MVTFRFFLWLQLVILLSSCAKPREDLIHTHPAFQTYYAGLSTERQALWKPYVREGHPLIWADHPRENEILWLESRHAGGFVDTAFPDRDDLQVQDLTIYRFTNRGEMASLISGADHVLPRGAADGPHLFLYRGPEQDHGETFAHEWAHVRIRQYFPTLPLWLEEGWAMWLGEQSARSLAKARMQPFRSALDQLEDGTDSTDEIRMFYAISGRAVREMREKLDVTAWQSLIETAAAGGTIRPVLEPIVNGWPPAHRQFLWNQIDSTVESISSSR